MMHNTICRHDNCINQFSSKNKRKIYCCEECKKKQKIIFQRRENEILKDYKSREKLMNDKAICRYLYCDKNTIENEQYCSSECMNKEEKRMENKTRVGTRKQRGNSTKVKCANPACKNKTTNLKWCSNKCYTIVSNSIVTKRLREKTANTPPKFNFKCHLEECNNMISTNHPKRRFCDRKCKNKQDAIDNKAKNEKARELRLREETEAKFNKKDEAKLVIKNKGVSCSTHGCKGDTWKKGGYCKECQDKGLMKIKAHREYRTGINAITQGN